MTLREEVLKNSGLLTEMPIIKKMPVKIYFFGLQANILNDKTLVSKNEPISNDIIYSYIMGSTAVENIKKSSHFIAGPDGDSDVFEVLVQYNEDDYDPDNVFTGEQSKNILKHIISLSGQKNKILKHAEHKISDLKDCKTAGMKKVLKGWVEIKSFIEKEC